jgi:hypothetical protein
MFELTVRELAKSNKYQTLYMLAKEGSIGLFSNNSNYTNFQILFLNYLSFYNSIYTDIAMDYVIEDVLKDIVYEDAYMLYRNKVKMKDALDNSEKEPKQKQDNSNELNSFSWVMKKPKK